MLKEFLQYCFERHDVDCNQKYGDSFMAGIPYSFHLKAVIAQVERFKSLIKDKEEAEVLISIAAGHDLIEDARVTYHDILAIAGHRVAEGIYACTEDKGRNRLARHSIGYYNELKKNPDAVFVKLCDILANILFSKLTNSSMYVKYQHEYPRLKQELYNEDLRDLFEVIESELHLGEKK